MSAILTPEQLAAGDYNPAMYSPSASITSPGATSSSIFGDLGTVITGLSNTGLQWFQGVTKGISGQLIVPQPTQATAGQTFASAVPSLLTGGGLLIVGLFVVLGILFFRRK